MSVIHNVRIEVSMITIDPIQNYFGMLLWVFGTVGHQNTGAVRKDDECSLAVSVISEGLDRPRNVYRYGWLPSWRRWKIVALLHGDGRLWLRIVTLARRGYWPADSCVGEHAAEKSDEHYRTEESVGHDDAPTVVWLVDSCAQSLSCVNTSADMGR